MLRFDENTQLQKSSNMYNESAVKMLKFDEQFSAVKKNKLDEKTQFPKI